MYLAHFGFKILPFQISAHPDFFYEGSNRGAILEAIRYTILQGDGIIKVTGEVGSGKTMLCRVLLESLPASVETVLLINPDLSKKQILYAIGRELGLKLQRKAWHDALETLQLALIEKYSENKQVVILIDEAHAMPLETLEGVRLLSNLEFNHHKLLQLVLFGQPELDAIMQRQDLRALRERITQHFYLTAFNPEEVNAYLNYRLFKSGYKGSAIFSSEAVKLISQRANGLIRRINILADKSLLAAFADNARQVSAHHAKLAIRESRLTQSTSRRLYGLLLVFGCVALLGLVWIKLKI